MISLVIPTYNEERNIRKCILRTEAILKIMNEPYEIIVSDDGSTDRTKQIIKSMNIPSLKLISSKSNFGRGKALKYAYSISEGRYIIYIDADLSINPSSIKEVVHFLKEYPVVIGSKHLPKSILKYSMQRKILSLIYRNLVNILFGLRISDYQAGLKGFDKIKVGKYFLSPKANRWSWDTEILITLKKKNLKIKEIPIEVDEVGKYSSVKVFRDSLRMFKELIRMRFL
jgi:glycosyltransferase involved in cell wall biosynthesis